MKDLSEKFVYMIEAFECDFDRALDDLSIVDNLKEAIKNKNERLLNDIELLRELSFLLRHGEAKIIENGIALDILCSKGDK